jgi:hypothetical protein
VFVYSEDERDEIGQPPWDYALPEFNQVHQGDQSTPGHEVTHILLHQAWGRQGSPWAGEGIATLRNGAFDPVSRACQVLGKQADFAMPSREFDYSAEAYLLAAVVVQFVIERAGIEGVREYYESPAPLIQLASLTGSGQEEVPAAVGKWFAELCHPSP